MSTPIPLPPVARLRELFVYEDGKLFWRKDQKHGKTKAGDVAGWVSKSDGYARVGVDGGQYLIHRLVWRLHNPKALMPLIIDHIDGNRANNKIENLRKVTHSENMKNQYKGRYRPTSTGVLRKLLGE